MIALEEPRGERRIGAGSSPAAAARTPGRRLFTGAGFCCSRPPVRVLVTGHRGYIGVELCPRLRTAGFDVVGLDTGLFDDSDFRAPPEDGPALDLDLRDLTPDHLRGFGAIVHLGALCNDPLRELEPRLTYDINLRGSVNLARAARTAGVGRYVFASSCSLYGAGPDGYLTEQAAFNPVTPYGESKVEADPRSERAPTPASRRCTCATPPPTGCRGGCAPPQRPDQDPPRPARPRRARPRSALGGAQSRTVALARAPARPTTCQHRRLPGDSPPGLAGGARGASPS